eukprot:218261-Amphidinium_carterae.2
MRLDTSRGRSEIEELRALLSTRDRDNTRYNQHANRLLVELAASRDETRQQVQKVDQFRSDMSSVSATQVDSETREYQRRWLESESLIASLESERDALERELAEWHVQWQ